MAEQDLNIRLKLTDDASGGLKIIGTEVSKLGDNLKKTGVHVTTLGDNMQKWGSNLNQISRRMGMLGAIITGSFGVAMATASKYSTQVRKETDELKDSLTYLQVEIAEAILPAFQKTIDWLNKLISGFESLPKTIRDTALQFIYLTGVLLLLGSAATKIAGSLIFLSGVIANLWKNIKTIGLFLSANIWVAVIAGIALLIVAIVELVKHWEKVKNVFIDVWEIIKNAFLLGYNFIQVGFDKLVEYILLGISKLADMLSAELPKSLKWLKPLLDDLANWAGWTSTQWKMTAIIDFSETKKNLEEINKYWDKLKKDFSGDNKVKGPIVDKSFMTGLKDGIYDVTKELNNFFDLGKKVAQETATAMQSAFSDYFFNVFTGKLNSLEDMFRDFGKAVLRIIADVLAQMAVANAMSGLNNFFKNPSITPGSTGLFDSGGSGSAAPSLSGTSLTSRAPSNNNLTVTQPIIIQAWDTQDIMRNKESIQNVIVDSIQRNGAVRSAMRKYG
jgi:hypothetical protein